MWWSLLIAVIALASQHARADTPSDDATTVPAVPTAPITSSVPEGPPPPSSNQASVHSYRGQTLAADGLAAGFFIVSFATRQEPLLIFCIPTYLVIPPLVHLSKQRPGRALWSLSMRAGLPLLGALIGDSFPRDCGPSNDCLGTPPPEVVVGFLGGAVAAIALDAIFLANGDAPQSQTRTAWTPIAGPTQRGFALGVAGHF